jgi:hypothetical protein
MRFELSALTEIKESCPKTEAVVLPTFTVCKYFFLQLLKIIFVLANTR